jgi:hypothetical protein
MSIGKLLIPLLAGGAALFAFGGSASAKPGGKTAAQLSAAELDQIRTTLASADPALIRKLATELEQKGYTGPAADLRKAADAIDAAITATPSASPPKPGVGGTMPSVSLPGGGVIPGGIGTVSTPGAATDPARSLAQAMALMLSGATRGSENKNMVAAFQAQEKGRGFYDGNIDSLYGPKSALALALDFSNVPPKPLYWPKANAEAAKRAYSVRLLSFAVKDPQRAEEWQRAAQV